MAAQASITHYTFSTELKWEKGITLSTLPKFVPLLPLPSHWPKLGYLAAYVNFVLGTKFCSGKAYIQIKTQNSINYKKGRMDIE